MRSLLSEFRQFILRGNVVDLAVGIVIGVAFTGVVQALVRDFINPLIAALFGKPDFSRFRFTVHHAVFSYGDFINHALTLIIIGVAVFFLVVKPVNVMVDRFHLSPKSPSPSTKTCPACFTDIPLKASKCPNCTSELAPPARDGAAARV
ncbi:MAG TPA: large conductance mechanosensitive channel protein MscL [Streptosporangiaceae bacterium]|jgi:large conductance mechanosensitive channel|nr:large conductance mechanosensitive channel protein MscL [Streptosporangiaceae bacterium]